MGSGFNFFTNAVDKTPGTTGSWQDVDVSGDGVPSGATGVILKLVWEGSAGVSKSVDVRKKGSTDDEYDSQSLGGDSSYTIALVGIDSNRKFQAKIQTIDMKIYLVGYADDAVTFFTNKIDYSESSTFGSWVDVDPSSDVPEGATGVIVRFCIRATGADLDAAVRKKGSTDDFNQKAIFAYWSKSFIYCLCGVDSNRKFQQYVESGDVDLYLVGYTESPITFKTNADDISIDTVDSWTDKDITNETASDADGAIIEILNGAAGLGNNRSDCRKNGSSDDNSRVVTIRDGHTFICVGLDSSQVFEGYIDNSAVDFKLIGYCKPAAAGETYTKTWQTDALFKKLAITKTAVVNAAFKKPDITKTFALNSAFLKTAQIQKQVDSIFKKLGITKTFNIDSSFLKHNILKSFAVDARFTAIATHTISTQINTLFKKHNIPKTFAIDTYIGEVSTQTHTKTIGIDTIFSYKVKLPPILGITLDGQLVIPVKKEVWIRN
jgi:hypothetical protein